MEDNDAAAPALAVPAMYMMRREDPEIIGTQWKFLAGIQENSAPALDHGIEFPIQPRMRADWHFPKAPYTAT
jgi:hypothetical protein